MKIDIESSINRSSGSFEANSQAAVANIVRN